MVVSVNAHDCASLQEEKGRRSWDGGPSGLLLLQTPDPAKRGRKIVKFSGVRLLLPIHLQAAHRHKRVLALQFLRRLGFLALLHWLRGWIHNFIPLIDWAYIPQPLCLAIGPPNDEFSAVTETKLFNQSGPQNRDANPTGPRLIFLMTLTYSTARFRKLFLNHTRAQSLLLLLWQTA
jgi:hypothetical protein